MFEPQTLPLSGNITATVLDPLGQVPQSHIIQIADPWQVRVRWNVAGDAVTTFAPTAQWRIRIAVESLGPGLEANVGEIVEPVGAPAASHSYDRTVNISGSFPGLTPGAYKLVTVMTLENGGLPCPLAGFIEGPVVQFYQFP